MYGEAKNVDIYTQAFLGEENTIDGVLFDNYFGKEENMQEFETWRERKKR